MLNRFPLWKYLVVIFAVVIGLVYALPNLFGEDPAVQISTKNGENIPENILSVVNKTLSENNIDAKNVHLENDSILVRLNSSDDQLIAREDIDEKLDSDEYTTALNLAPATPQWLRSIGAEPMKLGLDLRGGVRFLMEVDMNSALEKIQEQLQDSLRTELRQQRYQYRGIKDTGDMTTEVTLTKADQQRDAARYLRKQHPDWDVTTVGSKKVRLKYSDQALQTARENAVQQNVSILRKRVNELGVAEPVVQQQGAERIVVELPGVQDTARAKEILGATATLEFRMVNDRISPNEAESGRVPADSEVQKDDEGHPFVLYRRAVLGGEHIVDANSGRDQNGLPQVSITLDSEGGTMMSNATKTRVGKPMATLYTEYKDSGKKDADGKPILEKDMKVINVATIQSRLGNQFQITGINSNREAERLSVLLRAGALIAPIQIVEERTIGPSLGAKNIEQGVKAGVWGLVIVVLFMLVFYRKFGLFANLALCANIIILVGLMSLIPGATLTMPGIAGIILAVGMSVDANVLIFERIKEELRNGRSVQQAISQGYSEAFSSIFDANVTTILTALVLYFTGTGPVKGFAITLSLGVIISMFTAITGTRAIVNFLYGNKNVKKLSI